MAPRVEPLRAGGTRRRGRIHVLALVALCLAVGVSAVVGVTLVRRLRARRESLAPLERGRILWSLRRYDEAIESFELARRTRPDDPAALRGLAECYKGKGLLAAATSWAERAIARDTTPRALLLAAEIELIAAGPWEPLNPEKREPTYAERLHLEKAAEHSRTATEAFPDFGPGWRTFGEATARLGDLAKGLARVRKAIELDPDARATRFLAAELCLRAGKLQEALDHAQHVVSLLEPRKGPDAGEAADLRRAIALAASVCTDLKRVDEAIALWQKFIKKGGDQGSAHVQLAACYFTKGNYEQAVAEGDRADRLLPRVSAESSYKDWRLHRVRGAALLELKLYDRALVDLRLAVGAMPKDAETRFLLGKALLGSSQRGEARQAFLQILELTPTYWPARQEVVKLLEADGALDEALGLLRKGVAEAPQAVEPCNGLVDFCTRLGLRQEAEQALQHLVRIQPRSAPVVGQLARFHLEDGEMEKALFRARHGLLLEPGNVDLIRLRARAEAGLGRYQEAASHFEQAARQRPDDPATYVDWAAMLEALGQPLAAQEVYDRGRRAARDPSELRCAYARFCFARGREEEGTDLLRGTIEKSPRDLPARTALVDHLLARGGLKDALEEARQATQALPRSIEAHLLLARVHRVRGEWDQAIAALNYIASGLDAEALVLHPRLAGHLHEGHFDAAADVARDALQRNIGERRATELLLAIAEFLAGRHDEAVTLAERVASTCPLDPNAGFILPLLQMAKGDAAATAPACREYALPEIALRSWTDLVGLNQRRPEEARRIVRILLLAHAYETAGWHDVAAQQAAEILTFAPDCLLASCLVPVLWARAGERAKAIAACERLRIAGNPPAEPKDLDHVRLLLADLYLLDGKRAKARGLYAQVAATEGEPFDGRTKLALLDRATGDTMGALEAWRAILRSAPRQMPATNNAAWLLAFSPEPDLDEVAALAAGALDAEPGNPAVLDTAGWACYLRGETQRSVDLLEAAVRAAPHRALYLFHLGLAYARHRQTEKAERALKTAIDLAPNEPFVDQARQTLRRLEW